MSTSGYHLNILSCGFLVMVLGTALPCLADPAGRPAFTAPPIPDVRPLIAKVYPDDADGNRIADGLENRAALAGRRLQTAQTTTQRQAAQGELDALADVELIFTDQITQAQLDAFAALGGQIDYVYKTVSYGWNGRIPLSKVADIQAAVGANLAVVEEPKHAVLHLDYATRTGRVRPVWAAGFAGNAAGFDGDSNITVAIIDTGVDGTHTDLAGRQQYWHDYSDDAFASPQDLIQHGSHVTGIVLGSGAASGSAAGTLYYTDSGDMTGVPSGYFLPSPITLPASSVTFTSTAQWVGGGTTGLYLIYMTKGGGSWYVQGSYTSGASPLTLVNTFTGSTSRVYSADLDSNGIMGEYVVANSVTNYPGIGDGFNRIRGVAPGCRWAGAKAFRNDRTAFNTWIGAAIDDMVTLRAANNIKVMNLSIGTIGDPGIDAGERAKVNTAVNNGIVVCASAGNDGQNSTDLQRQIDDPGRAAMVITSAAANDINQLTDYSSVGFASPGSIAGQEEDYKPDIMSPGGSFNYSGIFSVDSNTGDGASFADQQANDYYNIQGTSMASPFTAGCAALVIDAMQQSGITWDFASSQHSRYVKMVLCATATESNTTREGGSLSPTLQRAAAGPSGFPVCKDPYEGYGMLNPDAAVEAVAMTYLQGTIQAATLGSSVMDRRAWARKVNLTAGHAFAPSLVVPGAGDFDMYLYSTTPSNYGTPVLLAFSTNAGSGLAESINYLPAVTGTALLVVKRVSGSGVFTLSTAALPGDYTRDGYVDTADLPHFLSCILGPEVPQLNSSCADTKFDADADVDLDDFGIWQRCYSGPTVSPSPDCAD